MNEKLKKALAEFFNDFEQVFSTNDYLKRAIRKTTDKNFTPVDGTFLQPEGKGYDHSKWTGLPGSYCRLHELFKTAADETTNTKLLAMVDDFITCLEGVLDDDWSHTAGCIPYNFMIAKGGTFLCPGVDDESDNWSYRGAFLAEYRRLCKALGRPPRENIVETIQKLPDEVFGPPAICERNREILLLLASRMLETGKREFTLNEFKEIFKEYPDDFKRVTQWLLKNKMITTRERIIKSETVGSINFDKLYCHVEEESSGN